MPLIARFYLPQDQGNLVRVKYEDQVNDQPVSANESESLFISSEETVCLVEISEDPRGGRMDPEWQRQAQQPLQLRQSRMYSCWTLTASNDTRTINQRPAGPQSPPLMMFIPSINAVISNSSSRALGNQQMGQAETSTKRARTTLILTTRNKSLCDSEYWTFITLKLGGSLETRKRLGLGLSSPWDPAKCQNQSQHKYSKAYNLREPVHIESSQRHAQNLRWSSTAAPSSSLRTGPNLSSTQHSEHKTVQGQDDKAYDILEPLNNDPIYNDTLDPLDNNTLEPIHGESIQNHTQNE
ncbi:MAG: hypothetical protein LQ350_003236 [Teloschistes chrysophthalmus]|nr:MAG: hypothetical protein LQ350_003236 [Niorma chrysophthalma]